MLNSKTGTVTVMNTTEKISRYVVCRLLDGQLWFYTSWDTRKQAANAAEEFDNGLVVDLGEEYDRMVEPQKRSK